MDGSDLGWVAIKAMLLYFTAVIGFRLGERRTLAEMTPFDFVAAIAAGAIVGRVPNAHDAGYLAGAVTLLTILVLHRLVSRLRYIRGVEPLFSHRPCFLVADGRIETETLRKTGITITDLHSLLRERGIFDMREVSYVIFEHRGRISVVRRGQADAGTELVQEVAEMSKRQSA